jgi:putative membrane protein
MDDQSRADPDSRARTHLANERTFLAWFRTGATMIAFGLAASQFLDRETVPGPPLARILATLLALAGTALVLLGAFRYYRGCDAIDDTRFVPASASIAVAAGMAVVAGLLSVLVVWLVGS